MTEEYARNVRRVRFRVLLCTFIFFVAGLALFASVYYLERAGSPGFLQTYGFAVLFGVIMGTLPVMSYLMTRALRRSPEVARCVHCGHSMWDNTFVAIQTALLNRCPRCFKSLRWRSGFDVQPRDTSDPGKPNP